MPLSGNRRTLWTALAARGRALAAKSVSALSKSIADKVKPYRQVCKVLANASTAIFAQIRSRFGR